MAVTINGTTGIAGASWTTSGRPASPVSGQQGYNTTLKALEVYINASWRIMAEGFTATGGTITTDGAYTVHSFTSSGTFTPSSAGTVEYLVVAGGGGRGKEAYYGGGGGAGGFLTATDFAVAATGLTVTIGAGGAESLNGTGADGSDSVFSSITADGGGGGAFPDQVGNNGGSGGGGGGNDSARAGGSATAGQGNDGGASQTSGASAAGGGGGAGGVGGTSTGASLGTGGVGGAGLQSSINGTATYYSAGGGGVNGYTSPADGANGTGWADAANLGHGGGAVTNGNGSSGIVIIRYLT